MSAQIESGNVHYTHPNDDEYCLCGEVCTRRNPQTTNGNNVDCLKCIMLHEQEKKAELD